PPLTDSFHDWPSRAGVVSTLGVFTHAVRKSKLSSKNSAIFVDTNAKLEMKTRLKPVYWENQKQCAAALGLDVCELREWKAENCPAFRFSRIYHAELLDWIAKKKKDALRQSAEKQQAPVWTLTDRSELPRSHWLRERERLD